MSEEIKEYGYEYFFNRELSWIEFNRRILDEARDKSNPLFERLKFLSITSSNYDEFFMIRVASLKDMVHAGYEKKDIAGMKPEKQLEEISKRTHEFVNMQYSTYNRSLLPLLKNNGLTVISDFESLNKEQKDFCDRYFMDDVYPVLTPMAVDSSRPFPLIRNKSLNIAALLKKKNKDSELEFATVQVPQGLPRFVEIPKEGEMRFVILLEGIIEHYLDRLFLNYDIVTYAPYRVMRNADLDIEEDEASDLLSEIEKQIKKRQWGEVIRLETADKMDRRLLKILKKELKVQDEAVYEINGPLDLTFLMKLYGLKGFEQLKEKPYTPQPVPAVKSGENIFEEIKQGDILMHHPYQTFDPVVDFVRQASKDPKVLAIKQTLYRVSGNSPIIAALAEAAENGKQVSVLVELKARFDEENNIIWARKLEQAGCHVIYGLVGLKTHCKITLVVRREDDGIIRYVHLGTGNYNDSTAKLYTDLGMFTCRQAIGEDATAVFNMLSGYSEPLGWNKLSLAPIWLRNRFMYLIKRETKYAAEGRKAYIIAKMNSLCDKGIIQALYDASAAGVKIQLIVRGICCLVPGIKGVSDNIEVRSIVGTFLEHSRIFCFGNNGQEEIYMGSCDWMPRNLDRRVEILFPVEDSELKSQVRHVLDVQLSDNIKSRFLKNDGTYGKHARSAGAEKIISQKVFCEEAINLARKDRVSQDNARVFIPMENN